MSIFNVSEKPMSNNSVVDAEVHFHQASTTTYNYNDEIRIAVEGERPTLPCESYVYVTGRLLKQDGTVSKTAKFINNGISHLFSEVRLELNGVTIDSVTKPGMTSTMKGIISYTPNQLKRLQNAGWNPSGTSASLPRTTDGRFSVCLPLSMLLGFGEDYKKIILNIRQELVLIRASNDNNAIINPTADEKMVVHLDKISWAIPHILGNLQTELALAKYMEKNLDTVLKFRPAELHTKTGLPNTKFFTWNLKSVKKSQSPLYIIIAFQKKREGRVDSDTSLFDHCNIRNVNAYLNSVKYPYGNMNLDWNSHQYGILYQKYSEFQRSYYNVEPEPLLNVEEFLSKNPIIVLDTSHQPETVAYQTQAINILLEFEFSEPLPDDVVANCLLIYERTVSYNALTKYVKPL